MTEKRAEAAAPGEFRPETLAAIGAVGRALALTRDGARPDQVSLKGPRDVVTTVDVAAEDVIRAALASIGIPVVGEERGGEVPGADAAYWLADPICGTRNFAAGIPLYCVNLALVERGQVTVAAVADASTGMVLAAERGAGAWAVTGNAADDPVPRRLATSATSGAIVTEPGKSGGARRDRAARFAAAPIRADRWDVCALDSTVTLAYLAAGRVAGYLVFRVTALHSAAGCLLAAEGGGTITDIEGRPWTIDSDSLLAAASPGVHAELLDLVRSSAGHHLAPDQPRGG